MTTETGNSVTGSATDAATATASSTNWLTETDRSSSSTETDTDSSSSSTTETSNAITGIYTLTETDTGSTTANGSTEDDTDSKTFVESGTSTATTNAAGNSITGADTQTVTSFGTSTQSQVDDDDGEISTLTELGNDTDTVRSTANDVTGAYTTTETDNSTATTAGVGIDPRGYFASTATTTSTVSNTATGNEITGTATVADAATSTTNATTIGNSSGTAYGPASLSYYQTDTNSTTATTNELDNSVTGATTQTVASADQDTLTETGYDTTLGYTLTSDATDSSTATATANEITGVYSQTQIEAGSTSMIENAAAGGSGYTLSRGVSNGQTSAETGNSVTGDYTLAGTEANSTTNVQFSNTGSSSDTYTETQSQSNAFSDIGNSFAGTETLTQSGARSSNLVDQGGNGGFAYSISETGHGAFTRTVSTDTLDNTYTSTETATNTYSLAETSATSTGSWTLAENGVDGVTTIEKGDSSDGDYTQTQIAVDSYTIVESGTLATGVYSLTLTGGDTVTQIEDGNKTQGTFDRTVVGGGSYTRTETGGLLGSASATNSYTLEEEGNNLTGNFSQDETGTDRYGLLEQFYNIGNTVGVSNPGHMDYHPFGTPFVDPFLSTVGNTFGKGADWLWRKALAPAISSADSFLGNVSTGWFARTSNYSAGWGDTMSFGISRQLRQWIGYDDAVKTNTVDYRAGIITGIAHHAGLRNPWGVMYGSSSLTTNLAERELAMGANSNLTPTQARWLRVVGMTGQALSAARGLAGPAGMLWGSGSLGKMALIGMGIKGLSDLKAPKSDWKLLDYAENYLPFAAGLGTGFSPGAMRNFKQGAATGSNFANSGGWGARQLGRANSVVDAGGRTLYNSTNFLLKQAIHNSPISRTFLHNPLSSAANKLSFKVCFAGETKLLARGFWGQGYRRIDEITVADEVASRDENNVHGPVEWKPVEELFERSGFVLNLHVGGQVIRTTAEHPFFEYTKGWVAASSLEKGDRLATLDGRWVAVEEVYDSGIYETVYNLRVADYHTYFVGGEGWGFAVWAHNAEYVYDARTKNYRFRATGRFVSASDLPWPSGSGFASSRMGTVRTGTIIDRYGSTSGRFAGRPGDTVSQRGLPPGAEGRPYTRYEVLKPIRNVRIGTAASVPIFDALGGGRQYDFGRSIQSLINDGFLRPI